MRNQYIRILNFEKNSRSQYRRQITNQRSIHVIVRITTGITGRRIIKRTQIDEYEERRATLCDDFPLKGDFLIHRSR